MTTAAFAQTVPLAVNGASEAVVDPGWPVIISALVTEDSDPPQLSIKGPSDVIVQIERGEGTLAWTISPETTASMAPGAYTVRVGAGKPVIFEVRVPTTAEDAARRAERLMLFAEYASVKGDRAAARDYAGELLQADPESVAARLKMADLLESEGKLADALQTLEEADRIVRRTAPS